MRMILVVFVLALASAAEDRTPREGSGWEGFGPGTWVRIKNTPIQKDRMLTVAVTTMRLQKAGEKTLSVRTTSENALGMKQEEVVELPRKGEAGPGEKESVESLPDEPVLVGEERVACTRTRTTVTGPSGKRVITKWVSAEPKAWVKRTETQYDAEGKELSTSAWLLLSFAEERTIGERTVACLKYRVRQASGDIEETGVFYTSREVPGNLVWMETETKRGGDVLLTHRREVLDFETK